MNVTVPPLPGWQSLPPSAGSKKKRERKENKKNKKEKNSGEERSDDVTKVRLHKP
jgi:ribosomal protein L12E/L44/L45/RPP1/RPP2